MHMDQRKKEDNMVERLKHPDEQGSSNKAICQMINHAYQSKHEVWLATDWHLWKRRSKNRPSCVKRSDFKQIINNILNTVKHDDLLIYMGDLVDGEFLIKKELKDVLLEISCPKILVRGNNDLFPDSFYKECGFSHVVDSFVWNDILFTHMPVKNDHKLNIHGHLHGCRNYWIPYVNQIDVGAYGGRKNPIKLDELMVEQQEYAKTIKESPEHFNEMELMEYDMSLYMRVMEEGSDFVHDPWYD